jgi:hypothetical protein
MLPKEIDPGNPEKTRKIYLGLPEINAQEERSIATLGTLMVKSLILC